MNNQLIKTIGEPIQKLIEEFSKGIGTLYKPRAIRKEADAEAYRIEILAKAEAKKSLIEADTKSELIERTKQRLYHQEVNRQANLENIAEKSISHLPKEVSSTPLDGDWRVRFFNKAQDISEEETQEIWAKILAGEIAKPGTISMRTLDTLSNINQIEAKLFEKLCTFVSSGHSVFKLHNSLEDFGISYSDILTLRDAGLLLGGDNLASVLKKIVIPNRLGFFIMPAGKKVYTLTPRTEYESDTLKIPQLVLSKAGSELSHISNIEINEEYIKKLIGEIENRGFNIQETEDGFVF